MPRLDPTYVAKQLLVRDVIYDRCLEEKDAGNKERADAYDKKVDAIRDEVFNDMVKNFNEYTIEEVLENMTRFGNAPCLVNADNGKFAVSGDGYQPLVYGDQLITGSIKVMVEAHMWKRTIREAVYHYLTYEEPEGEGPNEDTKWIDDIMKENGIFPKGDT